MLLQEEWREQRKKNYGIRFKDVNVEQPTVESTDQSSKRVAEWMNERKKANEVRRKHWRDHTNRWKLLSDHIPTDYGTLAAKRKFVFVYICVRQRVCVGFVWQWTLCNMFIWCILISPKIYILFNLQYLWVCFPSLLAWQLH